jgi:hypothetical protein
MRSRWERFGLRARVALIFAFGALLLSVTISLVTLTLTRQNIVEQRDEAALASFNVNGAYVNNNLLEDSDEVAINAIVQALRTTQGQFPLLRVDDAWLGDNSTVFGQDKVPANLAAFVEKGNAATIRTTIDGQPAIISGVLLRNSVRDATYY